MEKFEIKNGVLKKYNGTDTTVIIPNGVKVIGECAFAKCELLKEIIIPDSVKKIGGSAFSYCSLLTDVTLPKN